MALLKGVQNAASSRATADAVVDALSYGVRQTP